MAVQCVAGLVDVERDRRRRGIEGTAEDVDQRRRQAPPPRCPMARSPAGSWSAANRDRGRSPVPGRPPVWTADRRAGRRNRRRPRSRRRSRTCGSAASPEACGPSAPGLAIPGCSRPASRPSEAGAPPRATAQARRPTRSTRRRNRRSPSCGLRLEDRTGEGYLRSWAAWFFRCLGGNPLGNEFLTPRPLPCPQTPMNTSGWLFVPMLCESEQGAGDVSGFRFSPPDKRRTLDPVRTAKPIPNLALVPCPDTDAPPLLRCIWLIPPRISKKLGKSPDHRCIRRGRIASSSWLSHPWLALQ